MVVTPQRSSTGRRLYTDLDVEKLVLVKHLVDGSWRIGDVARLSIEKLTERLHEESRLTDQAGSDIGAAADQATPDFYLQQSIRAVTVLGGKRLETLLEDASVRFSRQVIRQHIINPLIETIGNRWRDGSMRVVHEHLATAVIRSFLGADKYARTLSANAPGVIVATPAGQLHELGALLAASAAEEIGWNAFYLGPNLPAEEIAAAVRLRNVRAVALSVIYPPNDPAVHRELRTLKRLLVRDVTVYVGGNAVDSYQPTLNELSLVSVPDLAVFQKHLGELHKKKGNQ